MTVNTKKVTERRDVHYDSLDELLADAERLAKGQNRTVGNWTLGQILQHLAQSMDAAIDGMEMKVPWFMKMAFGLLMNKDKMLSRPISAGFKIPKKGEAQFIPDSSTSTEEGLASLRAAVQRFQNDTSRFQSKCSDTAIFF